MRINFIQNILDKIGHKQKVMVKILVRIISLLFPNLLPEI